MSKLSYEEFISNLLERIEEFEINDFKNLVVKLALKKTSSEREEYLDFIEAVLAEKSNIYENLKTEFECIAENDYSDLIEATRILYDKVKDGYYDGHWGWDPEYHEERMMGDESWAEDAAELFLETTDAYRAGEYAIACKSYEMLFDIMKNEQLPYHDDYESMMDIDLYGQMNLFLICTYFSNTREEQPQKILEILDKHRYSYRKTFKLSDMINAYPKEIPQFNQFVKLLINTIINRSDDFYKDLLMEAIIFDGGVEGTREFARKNYERYPESYLQWILKLKETNVDSNKIIESCKEALLNISKNNKIRDSIAKIMIDAAINLEKADIVMEGIKEAFYSNPQIENVVLIIVYAEKYNLDIDDNIKFAIDRLKNLIEVNSNKQEFGYYGNIVSSAKNLMHKIYLLSNQISEAFKMAIEDEKSNMYMDNIKEFTKKFLLVLLSKNKNKCKYTIELIWNEQIKNLGLNKEIKDQFSSILMRNIKNTTLSEVDIEKYMNWCIETIINKVNEIVSNQYRGSYDETARDLIACAEMIANVKGEKEAYNLINGIKARYPRHTSFIKWVNTSLNESDI